MMIDHYSLIIEPINHITQMVNAFYILLFCHGHLQDTMGMKRLFLKSSLLLPLASQTLRHWPTDCFKELTSVHR